MENFKWLHLLYAVILISSAQVIVWFQHNWQFINPKMKPEWWGWYVVAIPITWMFLKGTYYGDAVIASIESTVSLRIASTEGLDPNLGVFATGYGATTFVVSQLPVYTTSDSSFKEPNSDYTKAVYAVNADNIDATGLLSPGPGAGWVGVTTYMGSDGELRVKSEILVAASGIATGGRPKFPTPLDLA